MVTFNDMHAERPISIRPTTQSVIGQVPLLVKLYLIAVILPLGFNLGPLYMTGLRLLLIVSFVPLLVQLLSGRCGRLYLVDYAFLIHIVWMAVAFAVNHPDRLVENVGATTIEFMGGYLVGRTMIRDRASFLATVRWLAWLTIVFLPLAIYESQTTRPPLIDFVANIPGLRSYEIIYNEPRLGLDRAQVAFAHPIHFGLFCSVLVPLVYVGLAGVVSTAERLTLTAIVGLCVFLSLSSGALLAVMLQAFMIGWYTVLRNWPPRWTLLLGLSVLAYVVVDILSNRSPLEVFFSYATFSAHNAYWRMLIFEWGVKNVFGDAGEGIPSAMWVGLGLNDWVRPSFMHTASMDNFWLVLAIRYGLPGMITLTVGYFWLVWKVGRRRDMDHDLVYLNIRRAWVITFVGLAFSLATVFVWTNVYSYLFFLFGAGMWLLYDQSAAEQADGESSDQVSTANTAPRRQYSRFPIASRPSPEPLKAGRESRFRQMNPARGYGK